MSDLESAKTAIESHFNKFISVYDFGDHIRFTNGSGGMYIDIRVSNSQYELSGQRYSENIDKSCNADPNELIETLRHTV